MKTVCDTLNEKFSAAMQQYSPGANISWAIVRPCTDPTFGDYQVNGVMALAKQIKADPVISAQRVLDFVDISDMCESPEVAGPGFINLRLKSDFVADRLLQVNTDSENRLSIEKTVEPKTIVVDFSCPNIAKQMHVGHLRSTIIGDCICRTLEFLGHKVIRQNHIGDWGLQMGMVIYAIRNYGCQDTSDEWMGEWLAEDSLETSQQIYQKLAEYGQQYPQFAKSAQERIADLKNLKLDNLEKYYKKVSQLVEESLEVAEDVRKWTVDLQNDDPVAKMFWIKARETTLDVCFDIYRQLGVSLEEKHTRGESAYKDDLPRVVEDFKKLAETKKSDGAVCVFPKGFKNKEGKPLPFIIQKSDGAYLYATTDLAALRYRVSELKANAVIYVTDARQKLHFEMLFATAKMAGWAPENVGLVHVMFGSVLGENGQPLKTRSGENVKLKELLDEAVERAKAIVEEKNPELPAQRKEQIAKAVGIGAVKYADFSNNRTSDYVFSFDKMLAMDGNTAPYMQYAYARIKSIERKAETRGVDVETELRGLSKLSLTEPAELDLAKYLIRYGEAIEAAIADYRPNYLTSYLYELAQKFSGFYTKCPVLDAQRDKRPTRLLLCDLTAKTIKHGLSELLGIEVVEQM